MENFYPAITGYAIVDILRNHMLIDKIVDPSIPAHFLVRCKCRNNGPREFCTSLHQGFQRENRTSVRPLHVSRSPPIDLVIPDCRIEWVVGPSRRVRRNNIHMPIEKNLRAVTLALESRIRIRPRTLQPDLRANPLFDRGLGNMAHRRRNTQLFELAGKNLRDLWIVQTRRNSSINTDEAAGKIN